jgi:inositol phosphorylceramide synthase catalytic subunit
MSFLDDSLGRWRAWWSGLPLFRKILPIILLALYWTVLASLGGLRFDLVMSSLIPVVLYYGGPVTFPIFQFLLPLFLVSIAYDSQRYYADLIRGPIHVKEPYLFDKFFFGIETDQGRLTPNEWWQLHTHPVLDFVCGLAYIIFIPVFVFCAAYWRFYSSKKGTALRHPRSIYLRSPQAMWAFFWVNVLGWSTYYWYAASPPWYVALYGLGPARTDVPPNLAGCVRFDAIVGYPVFQGWYDKSADVHGAIPSLHIAYPLQAVYYAFRFGALRVFTVAFFLLMCFSAVYLNHHYILDVIWGSAYAILVCLAVDGYWNHRFKKNNIIVPGV